MMALWSNQSEHKPYIYIFSLKCDNPSKPRSCYSRGMLKKTQQLSNSYIEMQQQPACSSLHGWSCFHTPSPQCLTYTTLLTCWEGLPFSPFLKIKFGAGGWFYMYIKVIKIIQGAPVCPSTQFLMWTSFISPWHMWHNEEIKIGTFTLTTDFVQILPFFLLMFFFYFRIQSRIPALHLGIISPLSLCLLFDWFSVNLLSPFPLWFNGFTFYFCSSKSYPCTVFPRI